MPAMESTLRSRDGWRASVSWWSRRSRRFDFGVQPPVFFFNEGGPGQQPPTSQNGWRLNRRATAKKQGGRYYGLAMRASFTIA